VKTARIGRGRAAAGSSASWARTSSGWFFGFKLHLLMAHAGRILSAVLTPANFQNQEAATALGYATEGGILLGDLGYRASTNAELVAEETGLLIVTPKDAGTQRALVSSVRERIETLFSQLWSKFIDRVFSRSWNGLWNTIKLKLLNYNLCQAGLLSA
jgi:transposase